MRILVPLPFDLACRAHGRNLRVIHLLNELSRSCEITIAAGTPDIAGSARQALPTCTVAALPNHLTPGVCVAMSPSPWWVRRVADFFGYDPALQAWIEELSVAAHVVLGFDVAGAIHLPRLRRNSTYRVPTACDLIDDPWLTFRSGRREEQFSTLGLKTGMAVQMLRRRILPAIDLLTAVAPKDAEVLSRTTGRPIRVVPNGVTPAAALPELGQREALIVMTGAMSFPPNEQAAQYLARVIWPRVRKMVPQARLALVGTDPGPAVQALAKELGVTVTGRVESIADWLRRARVAAAPMLGGTGLKNKILEAAAQGCPVVTTRLGAAGIAEGAENGILIADDPVRFSEHLVRLLIDPASADRLGRVAARMVQTRFSWSRSATAMQAALQECLSAGDSRVIASHQRSSARATSANDLTNGKEVTLHAAS